MLCEGILTINPPERRIKMYLSSTLKVPILFIAAVVILSAGCNQLSQEVDLVNNEAHKHQAFNQILDNPELQQEFMVKLMNNEEAMNRMMRDRKFTSEFFSEKNMNYIWDQNPGIDTTVIDNVTTRMHTDTNFMKKFDSRMERGTPSNIP